MDREDREAMSDGVVEPSPELSAMIEAEIERWSETLALLEEWGD